MINCAFGIRYKAKKSQMSFTDPTIKAASVVAKMGE